jgi:hypothetical protein
LGRSGIAIRGDGTAFKKRQRAGYVNFYDHEGREIAMYGIYFVDFLYYIFFPPYETERAGFRIVSNR